ncbi:EAL domain-containing protein [Caulobacter sp. BK020]|uniref:putative bifunctional diguanylate cyclase/phosphodiesterase n=1 Tax=Caulobacter sp. BK020 TaxID=2512117 RepID=UPI001043D3B3|nr:EAL domain-containing protein [Caulobacter sp. BK020]
MSSQVIALDLLERRSAALSAAERALRITLSGSPTPIVLLDLDLRPVLFSQGWLDQAVTPRTAQSPNAEPLAPNAEFTAAAGRCLETGAVETCRVEIPTDAEGGARWYSFELSPWPRGSAYSRFVVVGREVTEAVLAAREAELAGQRLAEQNARFDAALSNMPHGLCMFDAEKRLILCNTAYRRLYDLPDALGVPGTPLDDILEHRCSIGKGPRSFATFYAATVEAALRGAAATRDVELTDGRTIRITHNPTADGGYVATHEDVTESISAAAQIEFLAFRDPLTGLPNRAAFQRAYDDAVAAAEQGEMFGLIMLDVDHFKDVNDTLGHDAGDALLKALAGQLKRAFRRNDTVARLGGDEFAIVLRDLKSEADMTRPIEVLQGLLRTPIEHAGQSFTICASIGAAVHGDPDADPTHLLKNADVALYQAKYDGRNRSVVFRPAMRTEVEQRVELLREVRLAISQGEFDLFYQPVVDLAGNTVAGFEALMRWNHPEQGVLPPAAFMAAFEDNDLSLQLGEVAFERALGQMRAWLDQGVEFGRVAINISAAQFRTGRLAAEIAAKLARWNVPADRLTIEVTENVYMGWGAEVVSDTVRQLHDTGVLIALDDFGTGYASLANLRQFPIDRLKIDKSFVQNSQDDAIVRAVINLGSSMGMKVVAEGVERPDQVATLTQYGCDQVQGYHFARPMPATEVAGFIEAFSTRA